MATKAIYQYLENRPDKHSQELFVRGTGVRASTVWHDRYVSRRTPEEISRDRALSLEAVYEALSFCLENWEAICEEKELERKRLASLGFIGEQPTDGR